MFLFRKKGLLFFLSFAVAAITISCCSSQSLGQPKPPLPPLSGEEKIEVSGVVAQYLINPEGDIDGLLLSDGQQMQFPPHLSEQVARTFKPGDRISATGMHRAGPLINVSELMNLRSKGRIVDRGPGLVKPAVLPVPPNLLHDHLQLPYTPPPNLREKVTLQARGVVKTWLRGPLGEINGFVLSNKTIVRMPPETAFNLATVIGEKQMIAVEGRGVRSPFGTCIEAGAIGIGDQPLISIYGKPWSAH